MVNFSLNYHEYLRIRQGDETDTKKQHFGTQHIQTLITKIILLREIRMGNDMLALQRRRFRQS